jgi:hypothetical protein
MKVTRDDIEGVYDLLFLVCCFFCSEVYEDCIDPYGEPHYVQIMNKLNEDSWEIVTSDKYAAVALACPDCAAKDDKDR